MWNYILLVRWMSAGHIISNFHGRTIYIGKLCSFWPQKWVKLYDSKINRIKKIAVCLDCIYSTNLMEKRTDFVVLCLQNIFLILSEYTCSNIALMLKRTEYRYTEYTLWNYYMKLNIYTTRTKHSAS